MQFTKAQRNAVVESLKEVRAAQAKLDKDQADLTEKLGKLKTRASITGNNTVGVIDEVLKVLGSEVEKVGFAEE